MASKRKRTKIITKLNPNNPAAFKGSVTPFDVEKLIYERKELFHDKVLCKDITDVLETLGLSDSQAQKVESIHIENFILFNF